jgi:hypothetical protein
VDRRRGCENERAGVKLSEERISRELGLFPAPKMSPAMEFIWERLRNAPAEQADVAWKQALVELIRRKIPLDDPMVRLVADDLEFLYFPTHERKLERNLSRRQGETRSLRAQIAWIRRVMTGVSQAEAAKLAATEMGHHSGPAVVRRLQHRKRRQKP